ncbi:tetratricopeptide repeat protein [Bacteroidales bacterium AH-315-I05]|nr:tetratricopeptide repeat protein [Bacteroidales bacterium AH-315-I05]
MSGKTKIILLSLLFFFGLLLTYSNHFNTGFRFDDAQAITTNGWVRDIGNIPLFFTSGEYASSSKFHHAYRPMVVTLDTIDYNLGNGNPFYFHLSMFLWYIVQLVLMFFFFRKVMNIAFEHRWNSVIALFATAYYAFHTNNAETINYISARSDSFSTMCIVAAFLLYQSQKGKKYFLYLIPMLVGIYTKQTTVMFSMLLLVYILFFEEKVKMKSIFGKENRIKFWNSVKKAAIPIVLSFLVFFINSKVLTPAYKPHSNTTVSAIDYFISQWHVLTSHYLTNFFIPVKLNADPYYPLITSVFDWRAFSGLLAITAMLFIAFFTFRDMKTRPISFGILWFFIALAPTSSFIPLYQYANDHRVFFPFIGLILSVSWVVGLLVMKHEEKIKQNLSLKYGIPLTCCLIISAYAYGTYQRNEMWKSEEKLWYEVTVKSPENARGLMNYGLTQMGIGKYDVALDYFNQALKNSPTYSYLHINLGIVKGVLKQNEEAEQHFKKALNYDPENAECYYYYANWLKGQGRKKEALSLLKKSKQISPEHTKTNQLLTLLNVELEQDTDKKINSLLELLKTNPTHGNYIELSLAYYLVGNYTKSIDACKKALEIKPDYADAYNNICTSYIKLKQFDNAIKACNKALEILPNYQLAKNNLAWAKEEKAKAEN